MATEKYQVKKGGKGRELSEGLNNLLLSNIVMKDELGFQNEERLNGAGRFTIEVTEDASKIPLVKLAVSGVPLVMF